MFPFAGNLCERWQVATKEKIFLLLLLWGERFQCSMPKLMISMFSMTGLLCSTMPQEYKNDSFSSKEFWFRNSFLWAWQVHLASILVTIYLRGWEKWPQPTLIAVMKVLYSSLLVSVFFWAIIYTEMPSIVSVSPGAAQSPKHTLFSPPLPPPFSPSKPRPPPLLHSQQNKACNIASRYF